MISYSNNDGVGNFEHTIRNDRTWELQISEVIMLGDRW